MNAFLKSLKGRKSHYSLKDTQKTYLPEELNIKKLHAMFTSQHPENKVSYESFHTYFETEFNISFGYPRKDTCSTCDSLKSEIGAIKEKLLKSTPDQEILKTLAQDLDDKEKERADHLKKSERFYNLKKLYRKKSSKSNKSSKKLLQPKRKKRVQTSVEVQLQNCYHGRLPIKAAKFRDLLHLSQFLERDEAKQFYRSLNQVEPPEDDEEDNDEFIDDPPIDVDPDGE
ncbi:hypothetical protein GE061_001233 [Apolygus lucorum]|uniref:Uncharacterized protein n=1 Tax=Apolygus lucorum TaxID=248454 RepID=A0A8S9Y6S4_APOLU|nr:hypothetical protein GE061_001233 [Apolygus lucorum]